MLHFYFNLFSLCTRTRDSISITTGKTAAKAKPYFISDPNVSAILPASEGPEVHHVSPARASIANIDVPPSGIAALAILKVPGHIIPTARPQSAHPPSAKSG